MDKTVYCIPGLGNDERIFSMLDIQAKNVKYLRFVEPLSLDESVSSYCQRMLDQIEDDDLYNEPVLIGFSLGGILAIEMSKLIKASQVILINSIKSHKERPLHLNVLEALPAYRLIPQFFTKIAMIPMMPLFGFLPPEQEQMYFDMWENSSNKLIRWGVQTVLGWQHNDPVDNLTHIHGDGDLIFPISNIKNPVTVKGGTHVMITRKHTEVSQLVNEALGIIQRHVA
ncbi:alpha/beta hydrolase [Limibacter armeniacum]|uniref:alpha/beta hydrolase n=1 Tax=Limibacter armeniacum TaxID=466084 RepID=UPI002FE6A7CD